MAVALPVHRRVAIVGHSHVGRLPLEGYVEDRDYRLRRPLFYRRFFQGGATAEGLFNNNGFCNAVWEFRPELIVLFIGSNDIDTERDGPGICYDFRDTIFRLGTKLQAFRTENKPGIIYVYLETRFVTRCISPQLYNSRKNRVNRLIKNQKEIYICTSMQDYQHLERDGVHFTETGYQLLANKIQYATERYGIERRW